MSRMWRLYLYIYRLIYPFFRKHLFIVSSHSCPSFFRPCSSSSNLCEWKNWLRAWRALWRWTGKIQSESSLASALTFLVQIQTHHLSHSDWAGLCFASCVRLRFFRVPVETDDGEAAPAQHEVEGETPYHPPEITTMYSVSARLEPLFLDVNKRCVSVCVGVKDICYCTRH